MEAIKSALGWIWTRWKKVGHFITRILNTILLFLAYFIAIGPVSMLLRLTGEDVLDKAWRPDSRPESWWLPREPISEDAARFERQF